MQPCQAQMPSVRLKIAVVGTGGVSESDPPKRVIFLVGAAAAGHLVDPPGVGGLRAARERAAERDHRAHAIRHHLGQLTRIEAAEAPADQADLAAVGVVEFMHQIDHRMLHAIAQAEIAALAPAADGIAAVLQEAAQRPRRGVRGHQPGQHQHRMTVAPGREAEQRQGPKEGTEFVKGAPLQKHQGFGRRAQRLGSRGHRSSFLAGPLRLAAGQWTIGRRKPRQIVPQRNIT